MSITDPERVIKKFKPDVNRASLHRPRYNVAPTQNVAAMIRAKNELMLGDLRWGLVPSWAKDPGVGARMINARAETVAEKPAFRGAFKKRRCLVAADGFYEWRRDGAHKQPFFIHMADSDPFALAGLYEIWTGADGTKLSTCTIITTEPNELMRPIHDRMPVILPEADWERWLDPDAGNTAALQALLKPYPAAPMEAYTITGHVNSPAHDDAGCILRQS